MSSPTDETPLEQVTEVEDVATLTPPPAQTSQPTQAPQPAPSLAPVLPGALPGVAALAAIQSWAQLTTAVGMLPHDGEAFLQALELEATDPWHLLARAPVEQFWEE